MIRSNVLLGADIQAPSFEAQSARELKSCGQPGGPELGIFCIIFSSIECRENDGTINWKSVVARVSAILTCKVDIERPDWQLCTDAKRPGGDADVFL